MPDLTDELIAEEEDLTDEEIKILHVIQEWQNEGRDVPKLIQAMKDAEESVIIEMVSIH